MLSSILEFSKTVLVRGCAASTYVACLPHFAVLHVFQQVAYKPASFEDLFSILPTYKLGPFCSLPHVSNCDEQQDRDGEYATFACGDPCELNAPPQTDSASFRCYAV